MLSNKRKDSVEDSLEALIGAQSRKTATGNLAHAPNFKKVAPIVNCFDHLNERPVEDSKSTQKEYHNEMGYIKIALDLFQPFLHPIIHKCTKIDLIK